MPGYRVHLIGGLMGYAALIAGILLARANCSLLEISCGLVGIIIGSLFPDVDIKSKGQRLVYGLVLFVAPILWARRCLDGLLMLLLTLTLPLLCRHRGMFHNPYVLGALSLACFQIITICALMPLRCAQYVMIFFVSGWVIHLLLDRYF